MRLRRFLVPCFVFTLAVALGAQPASKGGINSIQPEPLKEWLGYIASDELQGRQIYTEGLGLAAAYIADHLKEWGVKPAGEQRDLFPDGKSRRREDDKSRERDRRSERPEPDLQGRRGGRVREEHGRQADDHGRPDRVRWLRPADPERERGRLREGRSEGKDGRVARRQRAEHCWNRVAAPADGTQPGRDRQGRDRRLRAGVWLCIWPRRQAPEQQRRRQRRRRRSRRPGDPANPGLRRSPRQVNAARRRRPRDADRVAEAVGAEGRSIPAISRPCSATTNR